MTDAAGASVRIELEEIIGFTTRLLAGENEGAKARREARLDTHDLQPYRVEIAIPARVIAANSSFLREFIRPSILKLGAQAFREKYSFTGPDISEDVDDEVRRALLELQRSAELRRVA